MKKVNKMRVACFAKLGGSVVAIAVAATLAAPTAAWAQTSESTLRGTAPAGATVVAKSIDTGAERRTTVNSDGSYVIVGLPAGSYHVTAGGNLAGDVDLSVASVSVLDFASDAQKAGTIVVTGKRQSVEVHSSQVNQIVSLHDIAALPQATRNFLEFADTVPGMQFAKDEHGNTSIRGGAQLDSSGNIYIDGVSQKDYVGSGGGTGGSGSGFTGSGGSGGNGDPGNPFPQSAIGEYKVVTSNYSAEYGDASSSIIIAQTKSGTNKFHGEVFGNYTDEHLRASRPDETNGKAHLPSKEYGVSLGGPIIKDVAHFFFAWEHKSLADYGSVSASPQVPAAVIALLPSNIQSQFGAVTNPFTENLYFGKIDLEPSDSERVELTTNIRVETNITGSGGQNAITTAVPYQNNVKRGDFHWQHSSSHWVNELRVSYQDAKSAAQSVTAAPQQDYIYFPNPANASNSNANSAGIINVGGPGAGVGTLNEQKGWTIADDSTFSNIHAGGEHTIKIGASFSAISLTTQNASADLANATYYYAVTAAGVAPTPYQIQYPLLTQGFNTARVNTTDQQLGAYIQDNWDVNKHLQINLGVRWDHEEVPAYLNYITPANVVAAINGPFCGAVTATCLANSPTYASVLATPEPGAPGININNYINAGNSRKPSNNFSPRIGFTYDFEGDGHHVLFGGYSRSYNRNLFSTLALETTKIALNGNPQIYFPSAQTPGDFGNCNNSTTDVNTGHCYAWNTNYLTPAGLAGFQTNPSSHEVDLMNNNIKTPYSDQFSLGIRNKIGDWNTQVTASYVASYNGIYGHWGERYSDGQFYHGGSQWGATGVPGVGSLILWDNGFKDTDFQLSLAAQKPYTKQSGWSASVSYTFSAATQNNAYAYGSAGNMYLFDYPTVAGYPTIRSTAVPRHRLVVTGTYDLPWDMQFGGKLALATPQAQSLIYGCQTGIPGCTGSVNALGGGTAGVSVQTPSGTFGYKDIDAELTKNFTIAGYTASARVDVLNVFNWKNYAQSAYNFGTNPTTGLPMKPTINPTGETTGDPFTVKFSASLKF